MSNRVDQIIMALVFISVSFVIINETRSILLIRATVSLTINISNSDFETSYQQNFNANNNSEGFLGLNGNYLQCSHKISFLSNQVWTINPQDYTEIIWQPPESV